MRGRGFLDLPEGTFPSEKLTDLSILCIVIKVVAPILDARKAELTNG